MAGVADAEILAEFRGAVAALAAGDKSVPEVEKSIGKFLDAANYRPGPGQEGTIKDLASWRRMRVSLKTNQELLQGWAQKERGMRNIMAEPCWELVRYGARSFPREWQARWTMSGGTPTADGRMIALKTDEIWQRIANFPDGLGVDYPPFAWGSGMGWLGVRYSEAKRLGKIPPGWKAPTRRPVSSPNETLQSTPRIPDEAVRRELATRMRGLAEWQGDKFVFTDPNGTRPMTPEQIEEVWDRGLPTEVRGLRGDGLYQRDALDTWVRARDRMKNRGGSDEWDDLQRLVQRLRTESATRLQRSVLVSDTLLGKYLDAVKTNGITVGVAYPIDVFQQGRELPERSRSRAADWMVVYEVRKPSLAKSIGRLIAKITGNEEPDAWAYQAGQSFRVLGVKTDDRTKVARVEIEEVPR